MGNFQKRLNSAEDSLLAPWGLNGLLWGNRALLRENSWVLALSQSQCRAANFRLLEGQRSEPVATAGAKGSSSGIWTATGGAGSTLGPVSTVRHSESSMESQAGRRRGALPPITVSEQASLWFDQLNRQPHGGANTIVLHSSTKSPGEEKVGHVWNCELPKVKAILTFSYWPLCGWNHPSSNKVVSMRNTYVTFKFASKPGSKVKLPASCHCGGTWPFVWT